MPTQATLPVEQAERIAAIRFVMFLGSLGVRRYEMPYATNSARNREPIPENMKCIIKTCVYVFLRGKGLPEQAQSESSLLESPSLCLSGCFSSSPLMANILCRLLMTNQYLDRC